LRSGRAGKGGRVRNRKHVIAIGLSEACKKGEEILLDELPILPVYWYVHAYLMRPELKGVKPSVLEHRCYKAWWLESSKAVP